LCVEGISIVSRPDVAAVEAYGRGYNVVAGVGSC
jgi:hypothetical protein